MVREGDAQAERAVGRPFDSERAREAARLRWSGPRAKDADDDGETTDSAILKRLRADARKGNVQSAREAREWERHLAAKGSEDAGFEVLWSELDPTQREALLVRLTRELCEELGIVLSDEAMSDPHTRLSVPSSGGTSPANDEPLRA